MIKFPESVEFNFISSLICAAGKNAKGVGDDAVALGEYLVSADMSIENTHFRLDWETPAQSIEKCLLSNFSDINAMGARADGVLLSICLNRKWSWQVMEEIALCAAKVCKEHKVKILGGDTTGGDCGVFSVTVFGKKKKKVLYRNSAKAGDDIYVSGSLGRSSAGLYILQNNLQNLNKAEKEMVGVHKVPRPPLSLGTMLSKIAGVNACMDLSDSLAESLQHISLQSNVSMHIQEEKIPVHKALLSFCKKHKLNAGQFYMNGGEDYELLFTATPQAKKALEKIEAPITCIGKVGKGAGCFIRKNNEKEKNIKPNGWKHFLTG